MLRCYPPSPHSYRGTSAAEPRPGALRSPYLATPHHTDTKTHRVDHAGEAGAVHISPCRLAAAAQAYTPTLRFPRCMVASKIAVSSLCAWLVVAGTVAR